MLLILGLVVRATRSALGRTDTAVAAHVPAPAEAPAPAAVLVEPVPSAVPVLASEQRNGDTPAVTEPVVPAAANGYAAPASEAIAITLWRGYTKARFMARSGSAGGGSVIATSEPFRWREGEANQSEAVLRAHAKLLAKLGESGWRTDEHRGGSQWYDIVLHRSTVPPAPSHTGKPDDIPVPLPAPR